MDQKNLVIYLRFFLEAFKQGHRIGWLFYQMAATLGDEANATTFFEEGRTKGLPLMPEKFVPITVPYYVATIDRNFSDWILSKNPDVGQFVRNVLMHRAHLIDTPEKWRGNSQLRLREITERKWVAADSFGGPKDLSIDQLRYNSAGRTTGKSASERTWAKK